MLKSLKCVLLLFLNLLFCSFSLNAAVTTVPVWLYYDSPPFALDPHGNDLTTVLIKQLNQHSQGKWQFDVEYIPRKRIDNRLDAGQSGVVLWANPLWFHDQNEQQYEWTNSILAGRNEIVSLQEKSIEYLGPESLIGQRFGGVLGHYYVGIDELVSSGKVTREDSRSFANNFEKLLFKRVDVALIPRDELLYLARKKNVVDKIFISKNPHQRYDRKILVTKDLTGVRE